MPLLSKRSLDVMRLATITGMALGHCLFHVITSLEEVPDDVSRGRMRNRFCRWHIPAILMASVIRPSIAIAIAWSNGIRCTFKTSSGLGSAAP